LSAREADEIFQLRSLVERSLHEIAVPQLDESDFAALLGHVKEMDSAVAKNALSVYASANRAFHFVGFRRSGSQWPLRFLNMLWDASARYQTSFLLEHDWHDQMSQHAQLLDAFKSRDTAMVHRVTDAHPHVTIESAQRVASMQADDHSA
jgi:DNA-binding GntR family transcriptional regulator